MEVRRGVVHVPANERSGRLLMQSFRERRRKLILNALRDGPRHLYELAMHLYADAASVQDDLLFLLHEGMIERVREGYQKYVRYEITQAGRDFSGA